MYHTNNIDQTPNLCQNDIPKTYLKLVLIGTFDDKFRILFSLMIIPVRNSTITIELTIANQCI